MRKGSPGKPGAPEGSSAVHRCTDLCSRFARTGDREVFDELAREARPFLEQRASMELARFGLDMDELEVVQETLLNLYKYARSFRPEVSHAFATWTSRIVRNVVLRFLRRRKTGNFHSIDHLEGLDLVDPRSPEPIRYVLDLEERRELRRNLGVFLRFYFGSYAGLTRLQQQVLHRVAVEDMNYRQVAEEMEMRVEAVKMVVFRARRRLAADMARVAG